MAASWVDLPYAQRRCSAAEMAAAHRLVAAELRRSPLLTAVLGQDGPVDVPPAPSPAPTPAPMDPTLVEDATGDALAHRVIPALRREVEQAAARACCVEAAALAPSAVADAVGRDAVAQAAMLPALEAQIRSARRAADFTNAKRRREHEAACPKPRRQTVE